MDTSQEYIRMCERAEEIQAQWLKHDTLGDFAVVREEVEQYNGWWTLKPNEIYIVGNDGEYDLTIETPEDIVKTRAIWLPRQDQLQAMVKREDFSEQCTDGHLLLACVMCDWAKRRWDLSYKASASMEQLWLALVMHELYHKSWTGQEWVKE